MILTKVKQLKDFPYLCVRNNDNYLDACLIERNSYIFNFIFYYIDVM